MTTIPLDPNKPLDPIDPQVDPDSDPESDPEGDVFAADRLR